MSGILIDPRKKSGFNIRKQEWVEWTEPGIAQPSGGERTLYQSEGWLSTQEAAQYLRVSRFVVGRLARTGVLASYTTPFDGRKRYYLQDDLDQLKRPQAMPGKAMRVDHSSEEL